MEKLTLKELAFPVIKAIDSFNYLLKSHHRRTAVISYHIGKEMNLSNEQLFNLTIAAALHDIGALSIQERDTLIKEDVENPRPHCIMGYRMLSSFAMFQNVARIIQHHHINYKESLHLPEGEVLFPSFILHLADRVDVLINPNTFILNQKKTVTEKIQAKVGTTFHPDVFNAFLKVSKPDIFWIEINNLELDKLFRRIESSLDFELNIDNILGFALTISRIIDFRSRYTASHSYTVAHLAHLLGTIFGFTEERCLKLQICGYLHDIGKIGIDPGLLEKKGPLSDEEFNFIKLHTYYTGQILNELSSSDWFREIVNWAENHHEKRDGSGYPYALTEESLDDGVKIIAFSDIISALMENRPYRGSMSIDESFDIIEKKIAPSLSPGLFQTIKAHKAEINALVLKCQKHTFDEYNLGYTPNTGSASPGEQRD